MAVGLAPVPDFLYGTAWKEDRTQALTELALRMGFRGIDTANQRRHYVEAAVGQGLAAAYRAGDDTGAVRCGQTLTDGGLDVVAPLVRGVDAAEAHPEGKLGEGLRAVFLPGGAVQEIRNGRESDGHRPILPRDAFDNDRARTYGHDATPSPEVGHGAP